MAERMSIIVFSGTVDKLIAASILTTGGAAMGLEVEVFLTTWGLEAFRKDGYKTNTRVSDARGSFCPGPLMELIRGMKALPVGGVLAESTRLKLLSLLGERSHTVKDLVNAKGER